MSGWTNSRSGDELPPERWRNPRGRVSDPYSRFERLTNLKPPALPGDTY